jgi:hypothetical protein
MPSYRTRFEVRPDKEQEKVLRQKAKEAGLTVPKYLLKCALEAAGVGEEHYQKKTVKGDEAEYLECQIVYEIEGTKLRVADGWIWKFYRNTNGNQRRCQAIEEVPRWMVKFLESKVGSDSQLNGFGANDDRKDSFYRMLDTYRAIEKTPYADSIDSYLEDHPGGIDRVNSLAMRYYQESDCGEIDMEHLIKVSRITLPIKTPGCNQGETLDKDRAITHTI